MASPFSSAEVLRHRNGIHAPRIYYDHENGHLTMAGRQIPVISPEQLGGRLRQIGCKEEFVTEVVEGIFGIAVPKEIWVGTEGSSFVPLSGTTEGSSSGEARLREAEVGD